jgi:hypothetical protein
MPVTGTTKKKYSLFVVYRIKRKVKTTLKVTFTDTNSVSK